MSIIFCIIVCIIFIIFATRNKTKNIDSGSFEKSSSVHQTSANNSSEVSNSTPVFDEPYPSSEWSNYEDTLNDLSIDFLSSLRRNLFADIDIKCGDNIFQAHKFVLSARSPVFEAMFATPMEESKKGVVNINDMDESVLHDLLDFIYGAQVKNLTLSKACDLVYAAEKYQVKGLKGICINFLQSRLSVQTALQILQFADLYDEKLKEDSLSYVCKNFSELKATQEWKTLQSQKTNLSIYVYSKVVEMYEKHSISSAGCPVCIVVKKGN